MKLFLFVDVAHQRELSANTRLPIYGFLAEDSESAKLMASIYQTASNRTGQELVLKPTSLETGYPLGEAGVLFANR